MPRPPAVTPHRLKMRDLERATGVTREAIRFYIREGLLPEPVRPAKNVAYYDESFVERIKLIKDLQLQRFLPLHVIKSIIGGDQPPPPGEVEALLALDGRIAPQPSDAAPAPPERLSALAERVGLPVRELQEMAGTGAVEIVTRDGDQWLEGASVRVAELWSRARADGFTAERGFGAENLAVYVDMVRWLAREELRMFSRGIVGPLDREETVRMAEAGIAFGNELLAVLRRETLLRFIAQGNVPETPAAKSRSGSDAS
jgi:DNA-binding transcriptional MerR regulator